MATSYADYRAANPTPVGGPAPEVATPNKRRPSTRAKVKQAADAADREIQEAGSNYGDAAQISSLGAYVRRQFEIMRRHRDSSGVSSRLIHCLRAYNGEYSPTQLAQIREFGGSDSYARLTAVKCRTLMSLLSELYLGNERPWSLEPTPEPTLPDEIVGAIDELIEQERQGMLAASAALAAQETGALPLGATAPLPVDEEAVDTRKAELLADAFRAAKERAAKEAEAAGDILDDQLVEGEFYAALNSFLITFSMFPIGILKGPFFKASRKVRYVEGKPEVKMTTLQAYSAPSPFDVWFSPGVSNPSDGDIIERIRFAAQDLERLADIDTGIYDGDNIRTILATHPGGYTEVFTSSVEQARLDQEEKESSLLNDSGLYDVMEFHGWVRGDELISDPLISAQTPPNGDNIEPLKFYHCTIRSISGLIISAHFNPDPLERAIYHTASFERIPNSVYGRGLPEVVMDSQALANAALRALFNNMAMASGPQVGINRSVLGEVQSGQMLVPWKVWDFVADPAAPSAQPIIFFQPQDNSGSLVGVLEKAMQLADEASAIPRYAAGSERAGGAARTASGLAQLQGNVARLVRYVAKGIDDEVLAPVLTYLYDMKMLTDTTGLFRGDETIRPMGVQAAQKQEAERMRALEMLQITANPIDAQLLGPDGRLLLLEEVAANLGFDDKKMASVLAKRRRDLEKQGVDPTANPANQPNAPGAPSEAQQGPEAPIQGMMQARTPAAINRATGGKG